jgi:N-acetylmuramic acid 6-phosphate etherase
MSQERLESSIDIDLASAKEIVRLIQSEDRKVADAVAAEAAKIAQAIDAITDRMQHGGRMFYVGAGTSGRIAMVDASELPPTYGIDPAKVQVIIAGGTGAFTGAVEGAEDDEEAAIALVNERVTADDCVIGIAASGSTPFTVAAVRRANMIGALTVGITSVSGSPLSRECDFAIAVDTGAEVVMGSSRMKSGTAQKMILNTISTGVMIRLGHVYSNLMVDMPATNAKLRRRAQRMVEIAAGVTPFAAREALEASEGNIRLAIVMSKKKVSADEARALLEREAGDLRRVLTS